jgi:hypothetical protein
LLQDASAFFSTLWLSPPTVLFLRTPSLRDTSSLLPLLVSRWVSNVPSAGASRLLANESTISYNHTISAVDE